MKKIFLYLFCILYFFNSVQNSQISYTGLVGYSQYMQDVMQTFIYDLEDGGLCKMKMRDFEQTLNDSFYTLEVNGILNYKNGFVVGIRGAEIKYNTISNKLNNITKIAEIYSTLVLHDVRIVYDLHANLTDSMHKATGIYPVKGFEYRITVTKDLNTNEMNVTSSKITTMNDQKLRMIFLPKNDYTAVFSRHFNTLIKEVSDSFEDWNSQNFEPILENVVRNKIPFPEISYDTHLDTED